MHFKLNTSTKEFFLISLSSTQRIPKDQFFGIKAKKEKNLNWYIYNLYNSQNKIKLGEDVPNNWSSIRVSKVGEAWGYKIPRDLGDRFYLKVANDLNLTIFPNQQVGLSLKDQEEIENTNQEINEKQKKKEEKKEADTLKLIQDSITWDNNNKNPNYKGLMKFSCETFDNLTNLQQDMVNKIASQKETFIGAEVGGGKTVGSLAGAKYWINEEKKERVLVVSLNSITGQWVEAAKSEDMGYKNSEGKKSSYVDVIHYEAFRTMIKFEERVIKGVVHKQRNKAFFNKKIRTDKKYKRYFDIVKRAKAGIYKVIIFDEVHKMKNTESDINWCVKTFLNTFKIPIRIGLSGTLIHKGIKDIHGNIKGMTTSPFGLKSVPIAMNFIESNKEDFNKMTKSLILHQSLKHYLLIDIVVRLIFMGLSNTTIANTLKSYKEYFKKHSVKNQLENINIEGIQTIREKYYGNLDIYYFDKSYHENNFFAKDSNNFNNFLLEYIKIEKEERSSFLNKVYNSYNLEKEKLEKSIEILENILQKLVVPIAKVIQDKLPVTPSFVAKYEEIFAKNQQFVVKDAMINTTMMEMMKLFTVEKLGYTVEKIKEIVARGEKVVVMTTFHDVIQPLAKILNNSGIKTVKYTGKEKVDERAENKKIFMEDPTVNVVIVNYQAGSTGTDGFQKVAKNLILVNGLYVIGEFIQAIGRVKRPFSNFNEVNIYTPYLPSTPDVISTDEKMYRAMGVGKEHFDEYLNRGKESDEELTNMLSFATQNVREDIRAKLQKV